MVLAQQMGLAIAQKGERLIYGGGGLGLMGQVARAAHEAGGAVTGIIPEFLSEAEKTLTVVEHHYVKTMHERKMTMYEQADAFIVLPGGIGTLEEAVEILSWSRLNLHSKPMVFLDNTGYWQPILKGFAHFIQEGFAPQTLAKDILHAQSAQEALALIDEKLASQDSKMPHRVIPET